MALNPCWPSLVLSLGLIATVPSAVVSQTSDSSPTASEAQLRARVEMLKLSSHLRLHTSSGTHEGRLILRTEDSLGLRDTTRDVHFPLVAIDSIWVPRHYMLPGFLVGAAAGAVAYWGITNDKDVDSDEQRMKNFLGAGAWLGSIVVGTALGRFIQDWKRLYP